MLITSDLPTRVNSAKQEYVSSEDKRVNINAFRHLRFPRRDANRLAILFSQAPADMALQQYPFSSHNHFQRRDADRLAIFFSQAPVDMSLQHYPFSSHNHFQRRDADRLAILFSQAPSDMSLRSKNLSGSAWEGEFPHCVNRTDAFLPSMHLSD